VPGTGVGADDGRLGEAAVAPEEGRGRGLGSGDGRG
jgi:hypothetical protein